MSVPQIVVVVMRTSASSGPTSGTGLSSSTMRPGSTKMAAFILCISRVSLIGPHDNDGGYLQLKDERLALLPLGERPRSAACRVARRARSPATRYPAGTTSTGHEASRTTRLTVDPKRCPSAPPLRVPMTTRSAACSTATPRISRSGLSERDALVDGVGAPGLIGDQVMKRGERRALQRAAERLHVVLDHVQHA